MRVFQDCFVDDNYVIMHAEDADAFLELAWDLVQRDDDGQLYDGRTDQCVMYPCPGRRGPQTWAGITVEFIPHAESCVVHRARMLIARALLPTVW